MHDLMKTKISLHRKVSGLVTCNRTRIIQSIFFGEHSMFNKKFKKNSLFIIVPTHASGPKQRKSLAYPLCDKWDSDF